MKRHFYAKARPDRNRNTKERNVHQIEKAFLYKKTHLHTQIQSSHFSPSHRTQTEQQLLFQEFFPIVPVFSSSFAVLARSAMGEGGYYQQSTSDQNMTKEGRKKMVQEKSFQALGQGFKCLHLASTNSLRELPSALLKVRRQTAMASGRQKVATPSTVSSGV